MEVVLPKPNYSFEKRQKELDRKKKKEAKIQRKQEKNKTVQEEIQKSGKNE